MGIQTQPDLAGSAKRKERGRLVRELIAENFLFEEMARDSIREYWDKFSPNQRAEFRDLFAVLFQDSYSRLVLNFLQKESVEYGAESPDGKGRKVPTVIMRSNEHIPVDYHVVQKGNRWMIRDVDIDGASIVETYRNSFQRAIRKGSVEGLLQKMRVQRQAIRDEMQS